MGLTATGADRFSNQHICLSKFGMVMFMLLLLLLLWTLRDVFTYYIKSLKKKRKETCAIEINKIWIKKTE